MEPHAVERLFARFESLINLERDTTRIRLYRLDRMEHFLARLGHPERITPALHIAGSKGKGSTAAYLASMLAASGLRVGLYTSPHVTGYRERFTIVRPGETVGGPRRRATEEADADLLARAGEPIWAMVEQMRAEGVGVDELPTTFELLTALAFRSFADARCDWMVLETGLGGRLDATNVCLPELCILTRIELEHTEFLGDTIEKIAGEKAGIIKPGVPVFMTPQPADARAVFTRVAGERGAPLVEVEPLAATSDGRGMVMPASCGAAAVVPRMMGYAQRTNVAAALAAWRQLRENGRIAATEPAALVRAVAETSLPGRGERIGDVILDGAHTPESVAQVTASLAPENRPGAIIFGAVAGKDTAGMARALRVLDVPAVVSRPGTFKPGDPPAVARAVAAAGLEVTLEEEPQAALARARGIARGAPVLVVGSFYMVAEIRRLVVG